MKIYNIICYKGGIDLEIGKWENSSWELVRYIDEEVN